MSDPRRWADRMSPGDSLAWVLDSVDACRASVGVLLVLKSWPGREAVTSACADLVELLPRLRQRVVEVPLAAAPPEWIREDRFDLSSHVHDLAVRDADLPGVLAALRAKWLAPLPRDRPLWDVYLAPRLADRTSVVFFKIHPSATQGLGPSRLLDLLTGHATATAEAPDLRSRTPRLVTPDALLWRAAQFRLEDAPADTEFAGRLVGQVLRAPVATGRDVLAFGTRALGQAVGLFRPDTSALVRQARRRSRRLTVLAIPIPELGRLTKTLAATESDLLLTLLGTALAPAEEQQEAITCWLPRSVPPGEGDTLPVEATTDLRLPRTGAHLVDDLERVEERTREDEPRLRLRAYAWLARWLATLPEPLATAAGAELWGHGDVVHLTRPGSARVRSFAGAPIAAAYPFAPVFGRPGLSIAAHVYRGTLFLGVDAESAAWHRTDALGDELRRVWGELCGATRQARLPRR